MLNQLPRLRKAQPTHVAASPSTKLLALLPRGLGLPSTSTCHRHRGPSCCINIDLPSSCCIDSHSSCCIDSPSRWCIAMRAASPSTSKDLLPRAAASSPRQHATPQHNTSCQRHCFAALQCHSLKFLSSCHRLGSAHSCHCQ